MGGQLCSCCVWVAHRSCRVKAGAMRHSAMRGCGLDPCPPAVRWARQITGTVCRPVRPSVRCYHRRAWRKGGEHVAHDCDDRDFWLLGGNEVIEQGACLIGVVTELTGPDGDWRSARWTR